MTAQGWATKSSERSLPAGSTARPAKPIYVQNRHVGFSRPNWWIPTACAKTIAECVQKGYTPKLIDGLGTDEPWATIARALTLAQDHATDAGIFTRDPRRSCDACWNHDIDSPCPANA